MSTDQNSCLLMHKSARMHNDYILRAVFLLSLSLSHWLDQFSVAAKLNEQADHFSWFDCLPLFVWFVCEQCTLNISLVVTKSEFLDFFRKEFRFFFAAGVFSTSTQLICCTLDFVDDFHFSCFMSLVVFIDSHTKCTHRSLFRCRFHSLIN